MQERMRHTEQVKQGLQSVEQDLEHHLKDKSGGGDNSDALKAKLSDLHSEYDRILKDGKALSQPEGSLSPKKASRRLSAQRNPRANDVQFAAEISEGLLVQCRKLQSLVNERDATIRDLEAEKDSLRTKSGALESRLHAMAEAEEKYKDENWDLELKLQELQSQLSRSKETVSKMASQTGKLQNDHSENIDAIESLRMRESELRKELDTQKARHEAMLAELKTQNEDLKAENTNLHQSISDLHSQRSVSRQGLSGSRLDTHNDEDVVEIAEDEDFDFEGLDASPPQSPTKGSSHHPALETETIKRSLGHAHKMVASLRAAFNKEKSEKLDLKRQLAETTDELDSLRTGSGANLRNKRSRNFAAQRGGLAAGLGGARKVQSRVYDESTDPEGWEDHASGTETTTTESDDFQSAFETAQDEPTDADYITGQETMDEGSEGEHTETEDSSGVRGGVFQRFGGVPAVTSSDSSDSDESSRLSRSHRNSRYRRSIHGVRQSPMAHSPGSVVPKSPGSIRSFRSGGDNDATPVKGQSLASEFLSIDDIERHAREQGMVVVSADEYSALTAKADPTKEDLEVFARDMNLELLPKSHVDDLKSTIDKLKSKEYITQAAEAFGLVAISKEVHDNLIQEHSKFSSDLSQLSSDHGLLSTAHSKLTADHDSMVREHSSLRDQHDELHQTHNSLKQDFEVLSQTHEDLRTKHDTLTQEHEKLTDSFDSVSKELARDLTPEELATKANSVGYVAIASKEYFELVRRANSPTIEELQSKLSAQGYVTMSKGEHERMEELVTHPTRDNLSAWATPMGLYVVDVSDYKDLKRLAKNPTPEELVERGKALGYAVIGETEYRQLLQDANEPSLENVHKSAEKHNHTVMSVEDHQALTKLAHEPTKEHVSEKAQAHGLRAIPEEEYSELSKRANEPDEHHIRSKVAGLGLAVLGASELSELKRSAEQPTREEIEQKSKSLDLVTLGKDDHDDLVRRAKEPTVEELKAHADKSGHTVIPATDYSALVEKVEKPDLDTIKSHAARNDSVVVPKSEYEALQNPSAEEVEKAARSHGLIAVPVAKYKSIEDAANAPPTKEFVETAAASLGLAALSKTALDALKKPSLGDITSHASRHGHTVVENKELEKLKNPAPPTADEVREFAKRHDLVAVDSKKYAELTKPYSPTKEEIESKAAGLGLVALPQEAYNKLKAEPTKEELNEKLSKLGLASVPVAELEELKSRPTEYKPSEKELAEHSKQRGLVLLPNTEHEEIKSKLASPSREYIEENASKQGLTLLPLNEYEDLKRKVASPSRQELDTLAAQAGLAVVTIGGLSELTKRADEPTREAIHEGAKRHGLIAVDSNDYSEIVRKGNEPTKDEVKLFASNHNLEIVPSSDLEELNRRASQPTAEEIKLACEPLDLVAVPKAELEQLEKNADAPDMELLSKHSRRAGMSLVAIAELEDLRRKASHPNREDLDEIAKKNGLVVVPNEEMTAIREQLAMVSERAKGDGSRNDLMLASVAAKRDHFEDIIKKSQGPASPSSAAHGEKIVESIKSLGYVPVSNDEYKRLLENQAAFEPTKRDVVRYAKQFNMVAIPSDEYKSLLKKGHLKAPSIVSVGSDTTVDESSAPSTPSRRRSASAEIMVTPEQSPSKMTRSASGGIALESVPVDYLSSLRRIVENPTPEDVESLAQKAGIEYNTNPVSSLTSEQLSSRAKELGLVVVPEHEMQKTKEVKEEEEEKSWSAEEVAAAAMTFGLVAVPHDHYNSLKLVEEKAKKESEREMTSDEVIAAAQIHGLVAIPQEEYVAAKQSQEQPKEISAEELEERAQQLNLVTLPESVYTELTSRNTDQLSVDDLKAQADKLGFLVVDKSHSRNTSLATSESSVFAPTNERSGIRAVTVGDDSREGGDIVSQARQMGYYVARDENELKDVAKGLGLVSLGALTTEAFMTHAQNRGFVAVPRQEYSKLVSTEKQAAPMTAEDVKSEAYRHGLITVPEDQYKTLFDKRASSNVDEVVNAARRLGYVAIPEDTYHALQEKKPTAVEPTLREVGAPPTVVKNNGRHTNMQSAVVEDASSGTYEERRLSGPPNQPLPSLLEDGVIANLSSIPHTNDDGVDVGTRTPTPTSLNGRRGLEPSVLSANRTAPHASNATIATSIGSLSERNMIPYVTQVVIGEYLFKYTRRAGLSGISDNRHERYFWVHPYTVTLYWSRENPALESRHSLKTKSAAIVSVKSVEDSNPLPPGLHHKSILIKTSDREIKVTCPTRQRHNIWYNSLLFLLKRSAEELNFDEDTEDGDYQRDERFEEERRRTLTKTNTRSRALSFRRSIAPEMNNARASRQTSMSSFQPSMRRGSSNGSSMRMGKAPKTPK